MRLKSIYIKSMRKKADPCEKDVEEDIENKPPIAAIGVIGNIEQVIRRPPPDAAGLELHINETRIHAGSSITGTVCLGSCFLSKGDEGGKNKKRSPPDVKIILEGKESTLVASHEEERDDNCLNSELVREKSATTHSIVHCETELCNWTDPYTVHFTVHMPEDLPTSMEFVKTETDGENTKLPSQCKIEYKLTVSIPNRCATKSLPIQVLGRTNQMETIDASLTSTLENSIPVTNSYVCGLWEQEFETFQLKPSKESMCLHPGQSFRAILQDPSHMLPTPSRYMTSNNTSKPGFCVKLTERIIWAARDRQTEEQNSWELEELTKISTSDGISKQVKLPEALHISYEGKLMQVRHDIVFFVRDSMSEVMATTPAIPVKVVMTVDTETQPGGSLLLDLGPQPQFSDTSTIGEEERLVQDSFSYDVPTK